MKKIIVILVPIFTLVITSLGFAQPAAQKVAFGTSFGTTAMELFIPALILFLLAFIGLSTSIFFGRKGISGSCSSTEGELLDIQCLCGKSRDCTVKTCEKSVSINAVCTDVDTQRCREIQAGFEKRGR